MKNSIVFFFALAVLVQTGLTAQTIRVARIVEGVPTMLMSDTELTVALSKVLKGDDLVIGSLVKATDKLGEFYYVSASVNRAGVGSSAAVVLTLAANGDLTYSIGGEECIMECIKTQPNRGGQLEILERCKTLTCTNGGAGGCTSRVSF